MDSNYVTVKFKTPSGFKNIRIKKSAKKQQKQSSIRTGYSGWRDSPA